MSSSPRRLLNVTVCHGPWSARHVSLICNKPRNAGTFPPISPAPSEETLILMTSQHVHVNCRKWSASPLRVAPICSDTVSLLLKPTGQDSGLSSTRTMHVWVGGCYLATRTLLTPTPYPPNKMSTNLSLPLQDALILPVQLQRIVLRSPVRQLGSVSG